MNLDSARKERGCQDIEKYPISCLSEYIFFNKPGVAGVVLQTASSLSHSVSQPVSNPFPNKSSEHPYS